MASSRMSSNWYLSESDEERVDDVLDTRSTSLSESRRCDDETSSVLPTARAAAAVALCVRRPRRGVNMPCIRCARCTELTRIPSRPALGRDLCQPPHRPPRRTYELTRGFMPAIDDCAMHRTGSRIARSVLTEPMRHVIRPRGTRTPPTTRLHRMVPRYSGIVDEASRPKKPGTAVPTTEPRGFSVTLGLTNRAVAPSRDISRPVLLPRWRDARAGGGPAGVARPMPCARRSR